MVFFYCSRINIEFFIVVIHTRNEINFYYVNVKRRIEAEYTQKFRLLIYNYEIIITIQKVDPKKETKTLFLSGIF